MHEENATRGDPGTIRPGRGQDPRRDARGRRMRSGEGGIAADMVMGAAAGALGVWMMDRLDWFMFDHEDPQARRRTQRARPGAMDPARVMANRAAGKAGTRLAPAQPHPAGLAVHYGLGVGPGALYAALRDRVPYVGAGRGTLWGGALFLLQDELLNTAAGLSGRPGDYPPQAHARGLLAHLAYGFVTDAAISAMKGIAGSGGRRR